uniref:Transmembrane protein 44 n=1 Tax=Esox lucius TaxID=8010 RepID=A0AAY5L4D7_ESOLU
MTEDTQRVKNGQSRTNELWFDLTSWWRPDITCFSNAQKMCIASGLSGLSAILNLALNSGEAACVLYSFLGNVCSTVGAFLSNQLALQVTIHLSLDYKQIEFLPERKQSIWFPWVSLRLSERRLRMKRRRRRQNLMAVPLLLLVVVGGGSYLTSRNSLQPIDRPLTGRRLFTDLLLDSTEVLGYILGLLSLVIAWTSRFPALLRAHRGEMSSASHLSTGVLCFLAWALYTSAILLYNTQYEFVLRATPWLLASTGCAALDLAVSFSMSLPHNDVLFSGVFQVCLKEVTLSRETGAPTGHPLRRTVRVVRVDEPFTSETISDSSSLNSDLEVRFRKVLTSSVHINNLCQCFVEFFAKQCRVFLRDNFNGSIEI